MTTRPSAASGARSHEAELLEPAHLASGRRRVHAGGAGEVAERSPDRARRCGAAARTRDGTGRRRPPRSEPGVPVAAGPQPVELLERPLGRGPRRPRHRTLTYLLESSNLPRRVIWRG